MNNESWEEGEKRRKRVMMAPERKHDEDNWEGRDRKRRGNEKLRQKEGGLRLGNKERRRKGRRRRRKKKTHLNSDSGDGEVVDGWFVVDDVAMDSRLEDLRFGWRAVVIQHGAKRLYILKFGSETGPHYVVTVRHTLHAIPGQVRVRLVGT